MTKPSQPTTQVRQPDSPDTKTIRTNDPITNKEEERLANEAQEEQEQIGEEQRKQQDEDAKRQQEEFKARQDLLKEIVQSNEGYVVRDEGNQKALDLAMADGSVYCVNVQSGRGGLDVEERVFLSESGTSQLKTAFGPGMGKG
jgi:hypothetical protein